MRLVWTRTVFGTMGTGTSVGVQALAADCRCDAASGERLKAGHQRLLKRQSRRTVSLVASSVVYLMFVLSALCFGVRAPAQSAIDLLSGFDARRIEGCYPVSDSKVAGEMARLLFRLRKADEDALASRSVGSLTDAAIAARLTTGDSVEVEGTIAAVRQYNVPESLIEFLELETFQELVLELPDSEDSIAVFAPSLVGKVSEGDRVKANAVVIDASSAEQVFAAGRVAWFPAMAETVGWKLLARQGVDLSRIAEAASRNRRSLEAADGDAFYSMLAAAKNLNTEPFDRNVSLAPLRIEPVKLLESPQDYHGQWIRMNASTVRITRISVSDPARRAQLGQDHYYQVDASGDLGNTIIQLARGADDPGEPIRMSGTYPVSLVAAELPDFLSAERDDPKAVVTMLSHPVAIEGFFYRLWSYKNEFMTREGGGKQVGPLIVVSQWHSMAPPANEDGGVRVIGYALAIGIALAILATIWWTRRNAKEDAEVRRRASQTTTIDL
ncbi:hypothetical protein TBK1r_65450 [Stieleria magnilauensis]|uniref:MacB-like periplasmic core domain-containing protein n=1 Tax=Stieleria magnilauensis TaxID=2527963 RepID=A0ABX5XZT7_9BACT|nr:hypothetical protein TBK1r_65450 [Planctomycetes bacterium TBK1r]